MTTLVRAVIALHVVMLLAACSPVAPTTVLTLDSISYVRVKPVVAPEDRISLNYSYPIVGDPEHRSWVGSVTLGQAGNGSFEYEFAREVFRNIPIETECSFSASDQAVSQHYVG